jgi:hypothetical protein
MPKASGSRRTRHARNRATVLYDDGPYEVESGRDITVSWTTTGRISHSTALASEPETGSDSADPWTTGFFDPKTEETFIADLPSDEFLDFDPLEPQAEPEPEPEDRRKVRVSFTFECSRIDKRS